MIIPEIESYNIENTRTGQMIKNQVLNQRGPAQRNNNVNNKNS